MTTTEIGRLADDYWRARQAHDEDGARIIYARMGDAIDHLNEITEHLGVRIPADVKKLIVISTEPEAHGGGILLRGHAVPFDDSWYPTHHQLERIGFSLLESCCDGFRAVWTRKEPVGGVIVSYCEGDLTAHILPDDKGFAQQVSGTVRWYVAHR